MDAEQNTVQNFMQAGVSADEQMRDLLYKWRGVLSMPLYEASFSDSLFHQWNPPLYWSDKIIMVLQYAQGLRYFHNQDSRYLDCAKDLELWLDKWAGTTIWKNRLPDRRSPGMRRV